MFYTHDVIPPSYELYISKIQNLALSKPEKYFTLRQEVIKYVKKDGVGKFYETLIAVLSKGETLDGEPIGSDVKLGGKIGQFCPMYPPESINLLCIQIANDLCDHINRAIDTILPDDFEKLKNIKKNTLKYPYLPLSLVVGAVIATVMLGIAHRTLVL